MSDMISNLTINIFFLAILASLFGIILPQADENTTTTSTTTSNPPESKLECYQYCINQSNTFKNECRRYDEEYSAICEWPQNNACYIRLDGDAQVFGCASQTFEDDCITSYEEGRSLCHVCSQSLCNSPEEAKKFKGRQRPIGVKKCYAFNSEEDKEIRIDFCPNSHKIYYECMSASDFVNNTILKICAPIREDIPQYLLELCEEAEESETKACYRCRKDLCNFRNATKSDKKIKPKNTSNNYYAPKYYFVLLAAFVINKLLNN